MSETSYRPDDKVPCGVPGCGTVFPIREMASLTDKNGAGWFICPDCIDGMWARKPWSPAPEVPTTEPSLLVVWERERLVIALARFVGSMQLLRDLFIEHELFTAKSGFALSMQTSIDLARKAYNDDV